MFSVLKREQNSPRDLRQRALRLAVELLELSGRVEPGGGHARASAVLDDGSAWRKFQAICEAQGGMHEPPSASQTHGISADRAGLVVSIDNWRLAKLAKLAGAPKAPAAGIEFLSPLGTRVEKGQPLFVLHAQSPGELSYALEYLAHQPDIVRIADPT